MFSFIIYNIHTLLAIDNINKKIMITIQKPKIQIWHLKYKLLFFTIFKELLSYGYVQQITDLLFSCLAWILMIFL